MESRDGSVTRELTADGDCVLTVRDLQLVRGARVVLTGITFEVSRGEIVALMGLSGAGKTSVLRIIAGLERDHDGDVAFGSSHPTPVSAPSGASPVAQHAGMVFQFHHLFEHLTVLDNICLAPVHVKGMARRDAEARAKELLRDLGVAHRSNALPRELSGGEAQRAAIARALAMDPRLLLLDEPTAALDPARRGSLGTTVRELAGAGRAILFTSHDVDFVSDYATRVLVLADGVIVEQGDPREVLAHPTHAATRALLTTPEARFPQKGVGSRSVENSERR